MIKVKYQHIFHTPRGKFKANPEYIETSSDEEVWAIQNQIWKNMDAHLADCIDNNMLMQINSHWMPDRRNRNIREVQITLTPQLLKETVVETIWF